MALGTFAVGTDAFIIAGFLPAMAAELDISVATAGQSITIFAVTYAVVASLIVILTATMPRRRLLTIALTALAAASILSALVPTFDVLLTSRVFAAAGAAAYTPKCQSRRRILVAPERRGKSGS